MPVGWQGFQGGGKSAINISKGGTIATCTGGANDYCAAFADAMDSAADSFQISATNGNTWIGVVDAAASLNSPTWTLRLDTGSFNCGTMLQHSTVGAQASTRSLPAVNQDTTVTILVRNSHLFFGLGDDETSYVDVGVVPGSVRPYVLFYLACSVELLSLYSTTFWTKLLLGDELQSIHKLIMQAQIYTRWSLLDLVRGKHPQFKDLRDLLPGTSFSSLRAKIESSCNFDFQLLNVFPEHEDFTEVQHKLTEAGIQTLEDMQATIAGDHKEYECLRDALPGRCNEEICEKLQIAFSAEVFVSAYGDSSQVQPENTPCGCDGLGRCNDVAPENLHAASFVEVLPDAMEKSSPGEPEEIWLESIDSDDVGVSARIVDIHVGSFQAKHIFVTCPGVDDGSISVAALPNGVRVQIEGSDNHGSIFGFHWKSFARDFTFDFKTHGAIELKADECLLHNGVLKLVLQPPHLKFFRPRASHGAISQFPKTPSSREVVSSDDGDCDQESSINSEAWSMIESIQSIASRASCVSTPSRLGCPRCFLPRTMFQRPNGDIVTASEIKSGEQDVLVGLENRHVMVTDVVKYGAEERTLVSICTEKHGYPFVITADHAIVVEGKDGKHEQMSARILAESVRNECLRVFDGHSFHAVVSASIFRKHIAVVQLTFAEEDVVLAWVNTEPRRGKHRTLRALKPDAAVACYGAPISQKHRLLANKICERNTFLEDSVMETEDASPRSLSVGKFCLTIIAISSIL